MSRRGQGPRIPPDIPVQDGGLPPPSAKEAAQRLFGNRGKDIPSTPGPSGHDEEDNRDLDGIPLILVHPSALSPVSHSPTQLSNMAAPSIKSNADNIDPEPTLRDILAAVTVCNSSITNLAGEVKSMKMEISFVHQDMQKLHECTSAVEGRISTLEDEWQPLQRDVKYTHSMAAANASRLEDMENRLRRDNVRTVGIPEKAEGKNPVAFIEAWLTGTFGKDAFSSMFAVERAHRVPTRPPPQGAPPRAFLFRLLNYRDRDTILSKARVTPSLKVDNTKISLFPDFSAEVQRQRAKFLDIKKRLRAVNVQYFMLYQEKLKVLANGSSHFFDNPTAVMHWLDREERNLEQRQPDG